MTNKQSLSNTGMMIYHQCGRAWTSEFKGASWFIISKVGENKDGELNESFKAAVQEAFYNAEDPREAARRLMREHLGINFEGDFPEMEKEARDCKAHGMFQVWDFHAQAEAAVLYTQAIVEGKQLTDEQFAFLDAQHKAGLTPKEAGLALVKQFFPNYEKSPKDDMAEQIIKSQIYKVKFDSKPNDVLADLIATVLVKGILNKSAPH